MLNNKEFIADFLRNIREAAVPRIVRATLPFYGVQNDQVIRDRSGIFLRIGDEFFILTASHDLQAIVEDKIPLYVGWDESEKIPLPINNAVFHVTEENIRDVAIVKLTSTSAKKLMQNYEPIGLRNIQYEIDRREGLFLTCGYPQDWLRVSTNRVESDALPFLGGFFKGTSTTSCDMKYDESLHGLFEFTRQALGDSKQPVVLPPFDGIKGISGCGVWRICNYEENKNQWKPENCKLVAIQHRYSERDSYVHATWVKFAVDRLMAEYPQLIKSTNLIFPTQRL